MDKIYLVTDGDYSDYRVVAAFTSMEKAEEFKTVAKIGDCIEEFPLNPPSVDYLAKGYKIWRIVMLRDGEVETAKVEDTTYYAIGWTYEPLRVWRRSQALAWKGTSIKDCLQVFVWAKTEKQAIKVANEKRTQFIAAGNWD